MMIIFIIKQYSHGEQKAEKSGDKNNRNGTFSFAFEMKIVLGAQQFSLDDSQWSQCSLFWFFIILILNIILVGGRHNAFWRRINKLIMTKKCKVEKLAKKREIIQKFYSRIIMIFYTILHKYMRRFIIMKVKRLAK